MLGKKRAGVAARVVGVGADECHPAAEVRRGGGEQPELGLAGSAPGRPGVARDGVHVEVFADDRVVLLGAGISARPPFTSLSGRIVGARCYGALVTLDPTGLVRVRRGARLTVADLFRAWGQPLSPRRLAAFSAPPGGQVTVYVDGRRWGGAPGAVPLTRHAEIVLEVGPHVPPHSSYTFPTGL